MSTFRIIKPSACQTDIDHGFRRAWGITRQVAGSEFLSMGYGKLPVGIRAVAHEHDVETAIYLTRGIVRVDFGNGLKEHAIAGAGDFILIPAHVPHGPLAVGSEDVEYIVARATPIAD
ncbi:MAG: cupin domain-containing protein [Candidatus Sumerlaeaceae bacterium]